MRMVFFSVLFAFALAQGACAQNFMGAEGPTFEVTRGKGDHRLGLIVPKGWEKKDLHVSSLPKLDAPLPAKFNWMDKVTPVRDQGSCGSCWAFSATATVADVLNIWGKGSLDLSEQFPVSCDNQSSGCDGGWPTTALELYRVQGVVLEKDYPYKAQDTNCPNSLPHTYKIASWKQLSTDVADTEQMKQAIYQYGPISVAVAVAGQFQNYSSGIYNEGRAGQINHAVNIVGWDETIKPAHWIMRNSWGESWGEKGFMRIAYGSRKIGYAAAYVDVSGLVPHGGDVPPNPTPGPGPKPTPGPTPKPDPAPGPGPTPCPECKPCTLWHWLLTVLGV